MSVLSSHYGTFALLDHATMLELDIKFQFVQKSPVGKPKARNGMVDLVVNHSFVGPICNSQCLNTTLGAVSSEASIKHQNSPASGVLNRDKTIVANKLRR